MNSEKKVEFRDAFRGYNKQDVNAYILSLAEEYEKRKEDWETDTARLRAALDAAREEKDALSDKYKKLTKDHEILTVEKKKAENELSKQSQDMKAKKDADASGEAELSALKAELEKATAELAGAKDALAKQKKANDALSSELTTLKNKLADKNTEVETLKKTLTAAEKVSEDRFGELAKKNGAMEGLEAQIALLKKALDEKGSDAAFDAEGFFKKLDEKLTALEPKPTEKAEEKKDAEAPVKEKPVSEVDKKIDSFFGEL